MVAVPIPNPGQPSQSYRMRFPQQPAAQESSHSEPQSGAIVPVGVKHRETDWTSVIAAGTLVAGGALMVSGNRRLGLAVAAAGTALALLEEKEIVEKWWNDLPGFLHEAQVMLDKVEGYLNDANKHGHKLQSILRR